MSVSFCCEDSSVRVCICVHVQFGSVFSSVVFLVVVEKYLWVNAELFGQQNNIWVM